MYDPQQEDIWGSAIRTAESVTQPATENGNKYKSGQTAKSRGFQEAKRLIVQALRQAQRESIARRYPLVK